MELQVLIVFYFTVSNDTCPLLSGSVKIEDSKELEKSLSTVTPIFLQSFETQKPINFYKVLRRK